MAIITGESIPITERVLNVKNHIERKPIEVDENGNPKNEEQLKRLEAHIQVVNGLYRNCITVLNKDPSILLNKLKVHLEEVEKSLCQCFKGDISAFFSEDFSKMEELKKKLDQKIIIRMDAKKRNPRQVIELMNAISPIRDALDIYNARFNKLQESNKNVQIKDETFILNLGILKSEFEKEVEKFKNLGNISAILPDMSEEINGLINSIELTINRLSNAPESEPILVDKVKNCKTYIKNNPVEANEKGNLSNELQQRLKVHIESINTIYENCLSELSTNFSGDLKLLYYRLDRLFVVFEKSFKGDISTIFPAEFKALKAKKTELTEIIEKRLVQTMV